MVTSNLLFVKFPRPRNKKLISVFLLDSEGGRGSKKEEQREFMKRYNSSVMRELREEFSETPQEYSEVPGGAATAAKYRKVEQV